MQTDYSRIWPYAIAGLAVLLIYRRFRRSFGRQPMRPARMWIRIVLLILLSCSLLPSALQSAQFLLAELAGAMAGMALGFWGARHTRFAMYEGRMHYVPHTYTGIAVSLLFIGRLVYRLVEWYGQNGAPGAGAGAASGGMPHTVDDEKSVDGGLGLRGRQAITSATTPWCCGNRSASARKISRSLRPRPLPQDEAAEWLPADES